MNNFSAEDLSTIGGIATVSLLHSFIPTHWLPFSIGCLVTHRVIVIAHEGDGEGEIESESVLSCDVNGDNKQSNHEAAFGAVLHVISTSILGITAVTMANTIAGEETVHKLASLLLVVLGGGYILLFLTGKGGHSHSHNQPMEKMAVAGLVLVPALSPCATTLPVFLAVGNSSSMMVLAIVVLLFSTITVMTSLVALSFYGASQLKFHWVERASFIQPLSAFESFPPRTDWKLLMFGQAGFGLIFCGYEGLVWKTAIAGLRFSAVGVMSVTKKTYHPDMSEGISRSPPQLSSRSAS
ncbi:unnamed protein product [Prunus armeniaca]|uniref:Uncharacterized protein n=1 Tax=Prunus armeniaca TaxID=36596 RepID=A0A6J5V2F2_PRUAR|nr:unnamed protein product [Prunus armeniaca]